ncbi:hypothetical protein [Amycolatopsis acidicola]|uniref:hypothetical protein n=1 Tax=Amycolatopsis acidicola TaxID=2596893 RepID=UPI001409D0AD|nr:hypothetical protein [Amycolatopsis acidicola]
MSAPPTSTPPNSGATELAARWRWTLARVDPRDARRSLGFAGAQHEHRRGAAPSYRLGPCRIRCVRHESAALTIDGPSEAAVRDTARRLLYVDTDGAVRPLAPTPVGA